jgi:hypothetical protein
MTLLTNVSNVCATLARKNSDTFQSCKSFRDCSPYNFPEVICPNSQSFSLCIYSLLLINRCKGTSMFISEVLCCCCPCLVPSSPVLCLTLSSCLSLPKLWTAFSTHWIYSVLFRFFLPALWFRKDLWAESCFDCRAFLIGFCSCLLQSSALPVIQCLETYILSWFLVLCGRKSIPTSVTLI